MSKIISFCVVFAMIAACKERDESGLKDSVAVGPGGRTILLKTSGNGILIKECVDPKDLLTKKDCDKKPGTVESRPSTTEFRNHLKVVGLTDKLIDEITSGPLKLEVFLSNDKDPERRFVFNIFNSYVNKPKLQWKFVKMSDVNGTGFPTTFKMGSNKGNDNNPIKRVTLKQDFAVQTTEVTQTQWFQIMGANPSKFSKRDYCKDYNADLGICPNHPVDNVSWYDARAFIRKLNATVDDYKYRLPTDTEWEYFTRAGTEGLFNLKGNISPDRINYNAYEIENVQERLFRKQTVAVRSLDNANRWGLYDTLGNVREWVNDQFYDNTFPNSDFRGIRGGSWFDGSHRCRSSSRAGREPGNRSPTHGFRLVRTAIR